MFSPVILDASEIFDSASGGKAPVYNSPSIIERRHRILRETISMISKEGYDNFSMRELARRAQVAQATLYKAFGGREQIIVRAIYQYRSDFYQHVNFSSSPLTITGVIERTIQVHWRNLQHKPYTSAVMAIYNSAKVEPSLRQAILKMAYNGSLPFGEHLAATKQLARGVTPTSYSKYLARLMYATLSAWCVGEIADEDLVDAMVQTLLVVTLTSTKGAASREASSWLQEVRDNSPEWRDLKRSSGASPRVRRSSREARSK